MSLLTKLGLFACVAIRLFVAPEANAQPNPTDAPLERHRGEHPAPPGESACQRAPALVASLLTSKRYVDLHLMAQSLSLLCPRNFGMWSLYDAIALTHLDEHQRAIEILDELISQSSPHAARAQLLSAWTMVQGGFVPSLHLLPPPDAARIRVLAKIRNGQNPDTAIEHLAPTVQIAIRDDYRHLRSSPSLRPWLAGSLSALIPGAGQVYARSWQGAAASFVLNSLFITATVELAQHELYAAAAVTGTAGSIFYLGNILNAIDLAQRYNAIVATPHRRAIEATLVPEALHVQ